MFTFCGWGALSGKVPPHGVTWWDYLFIWTLSPEKIVGITNTVLPYDTGLISNLKMFIAVVRNFSFLLFYRLILASQDLAHLITSPGEQFLGFLTPNRNANIGIHRMLSDFSISHDPKHSNTLKVWLLLLAWDEFPNVQVLDSSVKCIKVASFYHSLGSDIVALQETNFPLSFTSKYSAHPRKSLWRLGSPILHSQTTSNLHTFSRHK